MRCAQWCRDASRNADLNVVCVHRMSRSSLRQLLVAKGGAIRRDQLHAVREFPVDTGVCRRFLERQREISGESSCVSKVLQCLIESIHRVSREELFAAMNDVASQIWSKLQKSSDTRFYVALSGDSRDVCFSKSTIFVSVMMMATNTQLADSFRGFLCHGQLLESAESGAIQHVLYADDGSFTGSQLTDGIRAVHSFCADAAEQTTLHIAILFISPQTRQKVESDMPAFRDTRWYMPQSQTQPMPVIDALRRVPGQNVMDIAHKFLDHDDLFSPGRDSVLGKPLFYTDLKMPDQVSAHPHFLLHPHILSSEGKIPFGESLVLGCTPPTDSDSTRRMMAGTLCPVPCYKKVRWYDQVLEITEHGVKRRRKL
jgi:hypothetical protein